MKNHPALVEQLKKAQQNYHQGATNRFTDNSRLDKFYYTTLNCLVSLEKIIKESSETAMTLYENPRTILRNFLDVTMNTVVNFRLDKLDFLSEEEPLPNPLAQVGAIASWLRYVKENNSALISLLEQQRLIFSGDEALWRIKYILQILELDNPHQRIRKTGIQKSLRFWCQHEHNITNTGEIYTDSKTGELARTNSLRLFSNSPTLHYAYERVVAKLPPSSIVRRYV